MSIPACPLCNQPMPEPHTVHDHRCSQPDLPPLERSGCGCLQEACAACCPHCHQHCDACDAVNGLQAVGDLWLCPACRKEAGCPHCGSLTGQQFDTPDGPACTACQPQPPTRDGG